MFDIVVLLVKVVFILIIYLFIFGVIRLIYLDIKSISSVKPTIDGKHPYIKLINRRELLDFKVSEAYNLVTNTVFGRDDNNDVVMKDPFMSGTHAKIVVKEGRIYIVDLGSKNGTFVNSNRLIPHQEVLLKNGDKIGIGQMEFLFVKG